MEVKKRVEKWDILKLVLIFLVVFGHLIDSFFDESEWMKTAFLCIYTFHMPVFIFVSGLFSKRTVNEKKYDKVTPFLLLFFVTKILITVSKLIAGKEISFFTLAEGGLPWYMLAMFAFPLITMAVRKFSPVYIFILSVVLACFVGYDEEINLILSASRLFVYYPFYFLGYCLDPKKIQTVFSKKTLKAASAIILVAFVVIVAVNIDELYLMRPIITGRNPYVLLEEDLYEYGALLRLANYAISILIGSAVICLIPNKLGKGRVARLGSRSIQVYVLQYLFIFPYVEYIGTDFFPNHPAIRIIISAVLITVICSLKFWSPIFKFLLNPIAKVKPTE